MIPVVYLRLRQKRLHKLVRTALSLAALLLFLPSTTILAEDAIPGMDHSKMGAAPSKPPAPPATMAYIAANAKMHREMEVAWTGNPDTDFVKAMIPHHQGAVEMARIQLQYGSDPAIRKLAEEVIQAQEAEFAMMQKWLASRAP